MLNAAIDDDTVAERIPSSCPGPESGYAANDINH